ncbi:MAG: nucleotidyltransferase domain-containing protein [Epsilonproteobacteria bacterium]|nr:nucleotidyltransferase domain-containing protein [Campylobacterota bacterium]
MRLTDYEIEAIIKSFKEVFKKGEIYLFGSRVDDTKRGGDIDLYIITPKENSTIDNKIKFLISLQDKIGEQKIDVVISKDKNRLIEQEAIKRGVKLYEG